MSAPHIRFGFLIVVGLAVIMVTVFIILVDLFGNVNAAEPVFGMQVGKTVLVTHPADKCSGEFCCLHNPSDHPLKDAPLNWRGDRSLMERICSHGVGHPDPDDLAHKKRVLGERYDNYAFGVHGCDGCC